MIAVTGATGHLGRLVIRDLLNRNVAPSDIVAVVRSPEKASELAARGVEIREADYTNPDALESALEGVDRLLLISSSEVGQRLAHHRNVVEAAQKAGVGFIAYTSIVRAHTNPMLLASEHRATEEVIRGSGIPYTFLRNGWYTENYTGQLPQILSHGALLGSAGEGRVSAAPRTDYAAAASAVLTGEGHEGAVYELGGDAAFTMDELAAEVSRQSGTRVAYRNLPVVEYEAVLVGAGLPQPVAAVLADADRQVANGHLLVETGDLRRLIGRPTTPLADAVTDALDRGPPGLVPAGFPSPHALKTP